MPKSAFLSSISDFMLARHYSKRTIKTYQQWIKRYILFNNKAHPRDLSADDIERFLTHLSVSRNVSPATQAIALNAIAFMYTQYLKVEIGDFGQFRRATKQRKLPTVLTEEEVARVLEVLSGKALLLTSLLYGSGLRRIELVRLRVNDVDLDHL